MLKFMRTKKNLGDYMFIKVLLLVVFFAVMIYVGWYYRNTADTVNDFVIGGREVGPWLTAFSYGTSYFSAVVFIGYAGQFGWKYGISATWAGIGNALLGSLLAWVVLGRRTRIMSQHYNAATMPEFFGFRFDSNALRIAASMITFVFLIPYTASLYNGLSRLFGLAFNIDYVWCIILMAVLTGIYVIAGGYMATAMNDFIQGIIMIFGIIAVVGAVLSINGGFMEALNTLSHVSDPEVSTQAGAFTSFFGPDPINLLGVVLLTSLGTWGLPQMVGKFYAIKDEEAINKGMIISTVFAFIIAGGSYFLGGFARLYENYVDIATDGYDAIIPSMVSGLPNLLIAILVILVLSASMSTLSALVLASSSTVTLDFIKGNIIKKMDNKQQVLWIRGLIVVFIAISAFLAIIQYKSSVTFIAQLMGISWGALAGAFLGPFVWSLYSKRTSAIACWCSFIFSVVVMIADILVPSIFPALLRSPINCGVFCMLVSLIIVPIISLFTPAPDKKQVDAAFANYDKEVVVQIKDDLGRS